MVVTELPSAWAASIVHDLIACPSTWTVHAPHWLVSQPTWVPVRSRSSRSAWTRRRLGSTSSSWGVPFTTNGIVSLTDESLRRPGGGWFDGVFVAVLEPSEPHRQPVSGGGGAAS